MSELHIELTDPHDTTDAPPMVDEWLGTDHARLAHDISFYLGGGDLGLPDGGQTVTMHRELAGTQAYEGWTDVYEVRYPRHTPDEWADFDMRVSFVPDADEVTAYRARLDEAREQNNAARPLRHN